jgi:hypothetical protein
MRSNQILSEELLERCAGRTAGYDRENRFLFEYPTSCSRPGTCWRRCRRHRH